MPRRCSQCRLQRKLNAIAPASPKRPQIIQLQKIPTARTWKQPDPPLCHTSDNPQFPPLSRSSGLSPIVDSDLRDHPQHKSAAPREQFSTLNEHLKDNVASTTVQVRISSPSDTECASPDTESTSLTTRTDPSHQPHAAPCQQSSNHYEERPDILLEPPKDQLSSLDTEDASLTDLLPDLDSSSTSISMRNENFVGSQHRARVSSQRSTSTAQGLGNYQELADRKSTGQDPPERRQRHSQ